MRKEFSASVEKLTTQNKKTLFLTGDLGFAALENVREALGERFINAGVSEQNMISMSAALASEGMTVICYSIAPFAVFRPAEQIRLDVCLHNLDVKIVGNGGGYGYGIMGASHHAIEDIAVLSPFQNMTCYVPFCNEDVPAMTEKMIKTYGPAYLRLGFGLLPEGIDLKPYAPIRQLMRGSKVTIVGMGPVLLNAIEAVKSLSDESLADVFVVSEMPLKGLPPSLMESIRSTGKLLIIEEHVARGGLGENLALLILENNLQHSIEHLYAKGYDNGLYGSQGYHQRVNDLDVSAIIKSLKSLLNEK